MHSLRPKNRWHKFTGIILLRSHAAEKHLFWKEFLTRFQEHLWVKANHYIDWFHKVNVQVLLTKIYSSPQQCCW